MCWALNVQTVEEECQQNFKSKVGEKYFTVKTCVCRWMGKNEINLKEIECERVAWFLIGSEESVGVRFECRV
jgi:hypothetical protein